MNNKVESNAVWSNINGDAELNMSSNSNFTTNSSNKACYKCGGIIPAESEFCGYCGIKLSQDCPKCNNRYSSQLKFCPKCGTNRDEYLLHQIRLEEQRDEVRIMQESKQKYKERIEYIIGRMKIQFAPMRYVYKVYYQDECGSEIEMANGKYLGQWYEDEQGNCLSEVFEKIYNPHGFRCGCVKKDEKWAMVYFPPNNCCTSEKVMAPLIMTTFEFDGPFVFKYFEMNSKMVIASYVKINDKKYILTQDGFLFEELNYSRTEKIGEQYVKNEQKNVVSDICLTALFLGGLWVAILILVENIGDSEGEFTLTGIILSLIIIGVMAVQWLVTPDEIVKPVYKTHHEILYNLVKQYKDK